MPLLEKKLLTTEKVTTSYELHKLITTGEEVVKGTDEVQKQLRILKQMKRLTRVLKNRNI